MTQNSKIEWTHHTFNPWWGCTRVSPGCEHCYAETFAKRTGLGWGPRAPRRFFGEKHWSEPLRWNAAAVRAGERRRVFCASMADVFEDRPDIPELAAWRTRLWWLIDETPALDWLLLTKRPENWSRMVPPGWLESPRPNVWAMTTAEDQERADQRIPELLKIPAAVRGVSYEPALGAVDFKPWLGGDCEHCQSCGESYRDVWSTADKTWLSVVGREGGLRCPDCFRFEAAEKSIPDNVTIHGEVAALDWLIVGGESGPGRRVPEIAWFESVDQQTREAGVALFVKQDGGRFPGEQGRIPDAIWARKEFPR